MAFKPKLAHRLALLGSTIAAALLLAACEQGPRSVRPPSGAAWPNEPVGFRVLNDWGFDQSPPAVTNAPIPGSPGWMIGDNDSGYVTRISDPAAPLSPPNVYQFFFPIGFTGSGYPPGDVYTGIPSSSEVYVGFWWKPSNPWQGHESNVNKLLFTCTGGTISNCAILKMLGTSPPYSTQVTFEGPLPPPGHPDINLDENVGSTSPLALGVWHRIELYQNFTGGIIKWWVDGVLVGSYAGCTYSGGGFTLVWVNPIWGGISTIPKQENDYFWFNHIHVSAR